MNREFAPADQVRDGSIVEATESWNNGPPAAVDRFNERHYLESKELDPAGPAPIVINHHTNALSNVSTGAPPESSGSVDTRIISSRATITRNVL